METNTQVMAQTYKHTYRSLCYGCMEPAVPFFDAIDKLLKLHRILDKETQKISVDYPFRDSESSIDVYVANGMTVVDERHMKCLTPPHKLKSYEDDSYNCSVLVHLLYTHDKEEQAQALLADLEGLSERFPGV